MAPQRASEEAEDWDDAYARRLLATVILAVIAFSSSMTIVSAVLGTMADSFGVTSSFMGWSVTGLFLALAVGTPIMGRLGDAHGYRRVFLLGAALLTVATAGCALSPTAAVFVGFRVLAGVGIAATMPTGMALVMAANRPEQRSRAMGWYSMVMTGAPVISLIIGGPMISAWGWRTVFFMLTPVAIAGLVASMRVIRPSPPGPPVPIDWLGAGLLATSTLSLLLGLERLASGGIRPLSVGLFLGGALLVGAFVVVERRLAAPLLRMDYFGRRNFTGPLISQPLSQFAYMGGFVITPLLLTDVFGIDVGVVALILTFRPGVFSLMSPIGGAWTDTYGGRPMLALGSVAMVASMAAFAFGAHNERLLAVIAGLMLSGFAMGVASPAYTTTIAASVEPQDMGVANGMGATVMNIGMLTGIQVMLVLLGESRDPSFFAWVFAVGGVVALAGLTGAWVVEPSPGRRAPS